MKKTYTKTEFQKLDLDSRGGIIATFLPDDFYDGQSEINFYLPPDFKGEIGETLPQTPPEIAKVEDAKFEKLVLKLTDKLFELHDEIEYDFEEDEEE